MSANQLILWKALRRLYPENQPAIFFGICFGISNAAIFNHETIWRAIGLHETFIGYPVIQLAVNLRGLFRREGLFIGGVQSD